MIHLHLHTRYSVGDGLNKSEEFAEKAGEGSALAITDHDCMGGVIEHKDACQKHGVKPLYGVEVTLEEKYHLTLLAKDDGGLKNLYKLCKSSRDNQSLRKYSGGVIALSGDMKSAISQAILTENDEMLSFYLDLYRDIFGDDFYLEYINHGLFEHNIIESGLDELSGERVRTNDVHYLGPGDVPAHGVLICDRLSKRADIGDLKMHNIDSAHLKDIELFGPEKDIAETCNVDPSASQIFLPEFDFPEKFDEEKDFFRHLVRQGLREKELMTDEYLYRAKEEVEIIEQMGYVGYFLIVWDFMKYAHRNNIPVGPGRGSGGGSLVAYSMGITDIDPIEHELIFERFLNPDRVSMPDFDIDFCMFRRTEVIEYVKEKYGVDSVGGICTYGQLKPRAAWKTAARVLSVPYFEQDVYSKALPDTISGLSMSDVFGRDGEVVEEVDAEYEKLYDMVKGKQKLKDANKMAIGLEDSYKNVGRHAAGVLISDKPLEEYTPVWDLSLESSPIDPDHGMYLCSQLTMEDVEDAGLVKFDFLGLKELSVIDYCLKLIKQEYNIEVDINSIPYDDKNTYDLISTGKNLGMFQISGNGISQFMSYMKPEVFGDIVAAVALYRPGPMDYEDGMHNEYVKRKHGVSDVVYPHESLEPVLSDTYGIIVYQEQVMKIAQVVAGYSMGQADILRRAVGKKKKKEMDKQKKVFLDGAKENGYTEELANELWDQIETFSRYGFNKAHSVGYAIIAYQTAWLKANYTEELLAAQMEVRSQDLEHVADFIYDASRFSIDVVEPDVQDARASFSTKDGKIYVGMKSIKNMNEEVCREIERNSPYESFNDFMETVKINKKQYDALLFSGAFDSLIGADSMDDKRQRRGDYDGKLEKFSVLQDSIESGQISMFDEEIYIHQNSENKMGERVMLEKEHHYLERYISGHPVDKYSVGDYKKISKLIDVTDPGYYNSIVLVKDIHEITTKNNELMGFVRIEDDTSRGDLTVFSDLYENGIDKGEVLYVEYEVDYYNERLNFILQYMEKL